jgi:phage gp46-like protein
MDFQLTIRENGSFDFKVDSFDFVLDEGLESAVVISLFTDRRVPLEELPYWEKSQRGWWGDSQNDDPNDKTGSKLWLLNREKQLDEVLRRAEDYSRQALAWMVEDGIAKSITALAEWVADGQMKLSIGIKKPNDKNENFSFDANWQAQAARS